MCEYCKVGENGYNFKNILTMEYGKGIRTTLDMCIIAECASLDLSKDISEDGKEWLTLFSETKTIKINYCPFCGRKLL